MSDVKEDSHSSMAGLIRSGRPFEAFAMIVDINSFARLVAEDEVGMAAQDTRDTLVGAIAEIEKEGGEVVAFMGDALLAMLPSSESVVMACIGIAKDVDRMREWISNAQRDDATAWSNILGGPSVKILIE